MGFDVLVFINIVVGVLGGVLAAAALIISAKCARFARIGAELIRPAHKLGESAPDSYGSAPS
mgnify:CR=1 FL=1